MKKEYAAVALGIFLIAVVMTEDVMNTNYLVALWSALTGSEFRTGKIVAADGNTYEGVGINKTTPVNINFVNGDKRCQAEYRILSPEIARKYGYDPDAAAEFEKLLNSTRNNR